MKQSNNDRIHLDLDQLERELTSVHPARKSASGLSGDDPLAELARIMRQDDPFAGVSAGVARPAPPKTSDFDDFLSMAVPGSKGTPAREPSLDSFVERATEDVVSPRPEAEAALSTGRIEIHRGENFKNPAEEDLQDLGDDDLFDTITGFSPDTLQDGTADVASMQESISVETNTNSASVSEVPQNSGVSPNGFDDMLAEFEAAMRDVGGEKVSPTIAPSLEPIVVPPPPAEWAQRSAGQQDSSSVMVAATVGAASIAAGAMAATSDVSSERRRPRRGMMIAAGVIGVALIGVAGLFAFGSGAKTRNAVAAPVIAAKPGVTKERPANPGGVEVPNQDKEVLQPRSVAAASPERVAPREEQPVDLRQAQATAAGQPPIRQIPGVGIVAPVTIVPPAGTVASPSVAGAQPVPRPVASVPISIAGQPAPVTPAPPAATPGTSTVSAPAPSPIPAAPVAVEPSSSPPPAASAEPRRVRTVPIRPEGGEAAPSRAQAQPRVVPSAPRSAAAPEAGGANAPLRITPQALRGTQRVASAPEADIPADRSTQTASAGGSGFAVQIAAEGSEEAARAKFSRVKGQFNQVLGPYNANIRSAEVNGRSVYRVRVGSFSREEAVSLCERLKSSGGSCFVAKN